MTLKALKGFIIKIRAEGSATNGSRGSRNLGLYYRTMLQIDGIAARVVRVQIDGDGKRGLEPL